MRNLQALILAALVVIAGLLYSISQKMSAPAPAAAEAPAAPAPQPTSRLALPQSGTATPAAQPARAAVASAPVARSASRRTAPAGEPRPAAPTYESIPRSRNPEADNAALAQVYSSAPTFPSAPVAPPPPPVRSITVPAGTAIAVRLLDGISTERNRAGDTFQASLEEPLVADGVVVAQRGANVMGRVVEARQSGRVAGLAEIALELDRISTVGGEVQIASDTMIRQAETSKGKDAATVGVMAGVGAAIGAIAGGRKGAGIGAGAGGAAGTATVMGSRGKPVRFDPETRLTFRLRAPITITADSARLQTVREDPDRPYLNRRN